MKLQIIVNDELLKRIDDVCAQQGYDRSEFVRNCIRSEIFSITDPVTKKVDKPMLVDEKVGPPKVINGVIKFPPMPKKIVKDINKLQKTLSNMAGFCKHGSAYGNCKFGCQPGKEVK